MQVEKIYKFPKACFLFGIFLNLHFYQHIFAYIAKTTHRLSLRHTFSQSADQGHQFETSPAAINENLFDN